MARIYYGTTASLTGDIYRAEIWDDPSGSSSGGTAVVIHGNGVEFQYQGEGNKLYENIVLPSRATVVFNVDNSTALDFFASLGVEEEGTFAMVIYKNDDLHWIGRIIADQNEYDKMAVEANMGFKVTSVDTLNLLKNYYVDSTWFGSSKRLNILSLIKNCFSLTGLSQYWAYLAPNEPFLIDAYNKGDTPPFSQYLKYLEVNLSSVIDDYDTFYNQSTDDEDAQIWVNCEEAIRNVLKTFPCQIRLNAGAFWIWSIADVGDYNDINYVSYDTDLDVVSLYGQLVHSITIGTGTQRNRFQKYPVYSFQPPLRFIQRNIEKLSLVNSVRTFANQSSSTLEAGPLITVDGGTSAQRQDIVLKATLQWAQQTPSGSVIMDNHTILYRYYCYNSGTGEFKIYNPNNQTWETSATIPDWSEKELVISNREQINATISLVTYDFYKTIPSPPEGNSFYAQFNPHYNTILNIPPTFPISPFYTYQLTAANFWGNVSLIQKASKPVFVKTTNTNNANASEIYEYDSIYGYPTGFATISGRGIFYNTNTSTILTGFNPDAKWMSLYNKAVKTLSGTWHDKGDYMPVKTILIGSDLFAFNGGTFNTKEDVWEGEWILIDQDFTPVVEGDEQELDDTDDNVKEGVQRLFEQLDTTRESVSNIPQTLPYLIADLAVNNEIGVPTENTYVGVDLFFNSGDLKLDWALNEKGKSVTFTAGENDIETRPDIILCDTTAGAIILNLPLAADAKGIPYVFKKTGIPHTVTINGVDIDGSSSYVMSDLNDVVTIKSDGVSYYVVGGMGSSGGGGDVLVNSITSNVTFGGNVSGDVYAVGTSFEDIFRAILIAYIAPIFATLRARYASSTLSTSDREIGTTFNVDEVSVNITGDNPDGDPPTSVSVVVAGATTGSGTVASGLSPAVGTGVILNITDGDYKRNTNGAVTFTVNGLDANGATVTTNISYQFKSYNYFGGSATVVVDASTAASVRDEIKLQRKALDTDRAWSTTGSTETNDGTKYSYIMYPASYGNLSQVLQGAVDVLGAFTLVGDFNILTENGAVTVSYRVYKSSATGAFASGVSLVIS